MAGSSRREQSARLFVTLLVAASIAIVWLLASPATSEALEPERHLDASPPATPVALPSTAVPEQPVEERSSLTADSRYWLDMMAADEEEPRAAADDDPHAAVLRGRLTVRQQPWIHPAGVEIRLTRSWLDSVIPVETGPEQRAPLRDEPRATTDEQGRFAFRFLPGGGEVFFLIGHGTEWQDFQKVKRQPRRGTELDVGDVFVDQRGAIIGRLELGGRPIAGVTLRAVDDPLLGPSSAFDELRLARTEGLDAYQPRGTLRSGPVPDWVVRRDRFLPFPTAVTDNNGAFRLHGVRPGLHDLFVATAVRHGALVGNRRGVLVAPGRVTDVGTIAADRARAFTLRFEDENGKPWVGAEVAFVHHELGFGAAAVRTDTSGRATLESPAPEQASLVFGMPGGGPWLQLPWVADHTDTLVVPLPAELRVTLYDEQRRPLSGGKVRTYVGASMFRRVDRALAGGMQPVEVEPGLHVGKCPYPLVIVAAVPGYAPAITGVTPQDPFVAMTLLKMQTMVVRTHDMQNRPIAGAAVRMGVENNPDLRFRGAQWSLLTNRRAFVGTTNDLGELIVPAWPATFSFQATHRDYAPSAGPEVPGIAGQRVDLLMRGGADVVGYLTLQQRPAAKGFRVVARQKPPEGHPLAKSGWLDQRRVVTGDGGEFAFRNLCAGIWELTPELPAVPSPRGAQRPRATFRSAQILLDDEQEMHLVLEAQSDGLTGPCITGSVLQDGARLPGAVVRMRPLPPPPPKASDREERLRTRQAELARKLGPKSPRVPAELVPWTHRCDTDVTGTFAFHDLEPDMELELRVDVLRDDHLQFLARRVVRAGTDRRPAVADFAVSTGTVQLSCSRNGDSWGNRMLRLRQSVGDGIEGARFDVLLDLHGRAVVDALPAGDWTVEPLHGGQCTPAQFSIGGGGALVVPLAIDGV